MGVWGVDEKGISSVLICLFVFALTNEGSRQTYHKIVNFLMPLRSSAIEIHFSQIAKVSKLTHTSLIRPFLVWVILVKAQHFRHRPKRAFCDKNRDLSPSAFPTFLAWIATLRRCLETGQVHIWQKVVVQCYDWTKAREHVVKFGECPTLALKKHKLSFSDNSPTFLDDLNFYRSQRFEFSRQKTCRDLNFWTKLMLW